MMIIPPPRLQESAQHSQPGCRVATWIHPDRGGVSPGILGALLPDRSSRVNVCLVLAGTCFFSAIMSSSVAQVAAILGTWIFVCLAFAAAHQASIRTHDEDLVQLEELDAPDGWLVSLSILQDDTVSGRDRGVLWFEDGKLNFSGEFTSFAIGGADLYEHARTPRRLPGLTGSLSLALKRPTGGHYWATFDAATIGSGPEPTTMTRAPVQDGEAMAVRVNTLIRGGHLQGHGQIPPLDDGPDRPSYSSLFVWALGGVAMHALWIIFLLLVTGMGEVFWPVMLLAPLFGGNPRRIRALSRRFTRDGLW